MASHTKSFVYTGALQSFVMPTYSGGFKFDVRGGAGEIAGFQAPAVGGGWGGRVVGTASPSAGDTIDVYVGSTGHSAGSTGGTNWGFVNPSTGGGVSGGAAGFGQSSICGFAGHGGNSSCLQFNGTGYVAWAGGGGGAGGGETLHGYTGGIGGPGGINPFTTQGQNGNSFLSGDGGLGGQGASAIGVAGGAAGAKNGLGSVAGVAAVASVGGIGGDGCNNDQSGTGTGGVPGIAYSGAGGGGGGGVWGGGGGSSANGSVSPYAHTGGGGGGGGGLSGTSSQATSAAFTDNYQVGDGEVILYWTVAPIVPIAAPTGTLTDSSQPLITFGYSSPDGSAMLWYRAIIFEVPSGVPYGLQWDGSAVGLPAGTFVPAWDSGRIYNTEVPSAFRPPSPLVNGNYALFLLVSDSGTIAGDDATELIPTVPQLFTLAVTGPTLAGVSAIPIRDQAIVEIQAIIGTGPPLSYLQIDRSLDGVNWDPITNGSECPVNLLDSNTSGFEGDTLGAWTVLAADTTGALSLIATGGESGQYMAMAADTTSGTTAITVTTGPDGTLSTGTFAAPVAVTAGVQYEFQVDATLTNVSGANKAARNVQAKIRWYDGYGTALSASTGTAVTMPATTSTWPHWVTASVTATAPTGAVAAAVEVIMAAATTPNKVFLDQAWFAPTGTVSVFDYGAPREVTIQYRVTPVYDLGPYGSLAGTPTFLSTFLKSDSQMWLICPGNPALSMVTGFQGPDLAGIRNTDQAQYFPEGGNGAAIVFTGTEHAEAFISGIGSNMITWNCANDAQYDNLVAMFELKQPLCFKTVYGDLDGLEQFWVQFGNDFAITRKGGASRAGTGRNRGAQIRQVLTEMWGVSEPT